MQPEPHTKTTLELITDRMFARHNGTKLDDGAHLSLAVEGGAMRGVVSMGMVLALYDLDILPIFDSYVGVSAGSINLAYALAGQGALGLSVYFEEMTDKDIVNLLRFRSEHHPIMNMRKIYDHAIENKHLDIERLKQMCGDSFYLTVTDVQKNVGRLISLSDAGEHLDDFLVAGALLPFIAGDPWVIRGTQYYDGVLHYIDPSQAARELNATHAMILNTYTQDKPPKPWGKTIERRIRNLDKQYSGLGSHYLEQVESYFTEYKDLPYGTAQYKDTQLYRLSLPESVGVGRLTRDPEKLLNGVKAGYKSVLDIFYQQGRVGILPTLM